MSAITLNIKTLDTSIKKIKIGSAWVLEKNNNYALLIRNLTLISSLDAPLIS